MTDTLDSIINIKSENNSYNNSYKNSDKNYDNIYLTFSINIIPFEQEKKIITLLLNSQYPYSNITNSIIKKVKKINNKISLNLLNSMKNSIIKNNMIIQYSKIIANNSIISEEYSNTNILHLSQK